MNKKLGIACGIIMIICVAICIIGYVVDKSDRPWWLILALGGILSGIVAMCGPFLKEQDQVKRHKYFIGCISGSIALISVFVFLMVQVMTGYEGSWIIIFVGGLLSTTVYMIDEARSDD